jgi:hypothetical protein
VPYNPLANPYIINPKELPSNQVAAAQVPAINIGTANQWCQSPFYLPNWADSTGTPGTVATQAVSPVATAAVPWPDALVNDRDVNANAALNLEKTRQTALQTAATNAITAINNLTGGAASVGVNSVTPNSIPHGVATPVTIQGSGFTGASSVTIGVACTSVVVVNDGEITCTTAATTVAGTFNVVVVATAGTGTGTGLMTYT